MSAEKKSPTEQDVIQRITKALTLLPREKWENIIWYAEGVIDMSNHTRADIKDSA